MGCPAHGVGTATSAPSNAEAFRSAPAPPGHAGTPRPYSRGVPRRPELGIRPAIAEDRAGILDVLYREPGPEMLGSCGSVEASRRFGAALLDLGGFPNPSKPVVVATASGRVVAMAQYVIGGTGSLGVGDTVRISVKAFGLLGALGRIPAAIWRWRVELAPVEDEFYLADIHVDPELRGSGVGSALLDWIEQKANEAPVSTLWLITGSANPARRLYERHGFTVTAERHDKHYEARTGTPGRIRMEKAVDAH